MPQAWRQHWVLPATGNEDGMAEVNRDRIIHSIGNLTLVTQGLGASMSNGPWEQKREKLRDHTTLFLNKGSTMRPVSDESAIAIRAHRLDGSQSKSGRTLTASRRHYSTSGKRRGLGPCHPVIRIIRYEHVGTLLEFPLPAKRQRSAELPQRSSGHRDSASSSALQ